jgi:hypothetical protein
VLADKLVRGDFGLRLAEGYQVGKDANKEKESQYYVRQYPQCAVSVPEVSHHYIILRSTTYESLYRLVIIVALEGVMDSGSV